MNRVVVTVGEKEVVFRDIDMIPGRILVLLIDSLLYDLREVYKK